MNIEYKKNTGDSRQRTGRARESENQDGGAHRPVSEFSVSFVAKFVEQDQFVWIPAFAGMTRRRLAGD